jgi:hypothetical protein
VAAQALTVGPRAVCRLLLRALEECNGARGLTLDHLDQLPALLAPLVEDLLKGVGDQRHRCVLPFLQAASTSRGCLAGKRRPTYCI